MSTDADASVRTMWSDLAREHGPALAQAARPESGRSPVARVFSRAARSRLRARASDGTEVIAAGATAGNTGEGTWHLASCTAVDDAGSGDAGNTGAG